MRNDHKAATRRALLRGLGGGAAAAMFGGPAFAQGTCRDGYGTPRCPLSLEAATAPVPPVFAPTGWKTLALEHIRFRVADYRKEVAFYTALLGWRLRSDDGHQAVMDIGDWGSCIFRQAPADSFASAAPEGRPARHAMVDGFAFVIADWNGPAVRAALEKRGLAPVADNDGKGFESFHVKDPDGWDLQICNGGGLARARRHAATATPAAPPPFASTGWRTVWLDHISFHAANYKKSVSFYSNLMGWKGVYDEGTQNEMMIGDVGDIIIRGGNPFVKSAPAPRGGLIDHISFGIAPWDVEKVREGLEARGLKAEIDTSSAYPGANGKMVPEDIYQAAFQSYHTTTPNGFDLQISWNTFDKRLALATAVKPKALRRYPQ